MSGMSDAEYERRNSEIAAVTAELEVALERARAAERELKDLSDRLRVLQTATNSVRDVAQLRSDMDGLRQEVGELRRRYWVVSARVSFTQIVLLIVLIMGFMTFAIVPITGR